MAKRLDYRRAADRDRLARQGADNLHDDSFPAGLTPPRQRASKADQRAELEAATAKISRIVKCVCGHKGVALVPLAKARARLRCSKCGEVTR